MTALLTDRVDGIDIFTLNVPEKRNALTLDLRVLLLDGVRRAEADPDTRAIIITGANGCFCSGGDISSMGQVDVISARQRLGALHELARLLIAGRKPVVTAVSGAAFGGGFSLALAGDYVIAGATARFCASFGRIGLVPDVGLMWTLPSRIGTARARQFFLDARVVDAEQAVALGIADDVVPEADLMDAAKRCAANASALAPVPTGFIKRTLAANPPSLDALLAAELDAQAQLFATADHTEACDAFLNKRPPRFTGA